LKELPDKDLVERMNKYGYKIINLPANPYL
jgi:hypothetical protein